MLSGCLDVTTSICLIELRLVLSFDSGAGTMKCQHLAWHYFNMMSEVRTDLTVEDIGIRTGLSCRFQINGNNQSKDF